MHPKRKQRLIIVSLMVALSSATVGLIVYALSSNINLLRTCRNRSWRGSSRSKYSGGWHGG